MEELKSLQDLAESLCNGENCQASGVLGNHCSSLSGVLAQLVRENRQCPEYLYTTVEKEMSVIYAELARDQTQMSFGLNVLVKRYQQWVENIQKIALTTSTLGESAKPVPDQGIGFDDLAGAESEKSAMEQAFIEPFNYPGLFPDRVTGMILFGLAGAGKCYGRGTQIMMVDGTIKSVEDVKEGDQVMGDDGTPRNVLPNSLIHNQDKLFKITPNNQGQTPFVCNEDHILVLKINLKPRIHFNNRIYGPRYGVYYPQITATNKFVIVNIPEMKTREEAQIELDKLSKEPLIWCVSLKEYLKAKDPKYVQYYSKMFKPERLEFNNNHINEFETICKTVFGDEITQEQLNLTAWLVGLWLADGVASTASISQGGNLDQNYKNNHLGVFNRCKEWSELMKQQYNTYEHTPSTENAYKGFIISFCEYRTKKKAKFRLLLEALGVYDHKSFPPAVLMASSTLRLHLLAGLIDGDGYLDTRKNCYEMPAKSIEFIKQIVFLCKSLGFRTGNLEQRTVKCKGKEFSSNRINISGEQLHELPVALPYKKCPVTKPNKDQNCWGFGVEEVGIGDYYGFALDGNHRFLLEDFTVTHNSILIKALVHELPNAILFAPDSAALKGKYEGETEAKITAIYSAASAYLDAKFHVIKGERVANPYKFAIIFIDEADSVMGAGRDSDASKQRTVNTFLQLMDGFGHDSRISTIAATNYPQIIDSAILRRLKQKIFVDLPTNAARAQVIRDLLAQQYSFPWYREEMKKYFSRQLKEEKEEKNKDKLNEQIRSAGGDFLFNIAQYGKIARSTEKGYFGSKEVVNSLHLEDSDIEELMRLTGPQPSAQKLMGRTDDEVSSNALRELGYSLADINTAMKLAFNAAAQRSISKDEKQSFFPSYDVYSTPEVSIPDLKRSFKREYQSASAKSNVNPVTVYQKLRKQLNSEGKLVNYYIFNPNKSAANEEETLKFIKDDKIAGNILNFDIRLTDIVTQLKLLPSSTKRSDYEAIKNWTS
jgi:SpoVK/Ycf46/Vps4 family AAA+-type ATPase